MIMALHICNSTGKYGMRHINEISILGMTVDISADIRI